MGVVLFKYTYPSVIFVFFLYSARLFARWDDTGYYGL
jgi:hypothetical protein